MRDRRDYRDRHVDPHPHRGFTWNNHKPHPHSNPRRSRRSVSPTVQHRRARSPDRRNDHVDRHPVHRRPVHQDHLPVHISHTHHSVSVRDRQYDLPPLNQILSEYPSDLNQEIKHKPHGLGPEPLSTHKAGFFDDGLGRSYESVPKQDSMLGGILTGGSHDNDLLPHHAHMLGPFKGERHTGRDRERSLYAREAPLSPSIPTSRPERKRERSHYAREGPPLVGTAPTPLKERDRERDHYTREREVPLTGTVPVLTPATERDRERNHYTREREIPLAGTVPILSPVTERDRERNHYTSKASLSNTIQTSRVERDRERNRYTGEASLSSTVPTSRTERDRERNSPLSPLSNTIPISRTERDRERNHYERDAPLSNPLPTYPSLYRDHVYEKGSDDLLKRRDRVSGSYKSLASDEMYRKPPSYQSDYTRHYSPRGERDGRVFVDPVHSNYSPRPMHMHVLPFNNEDMAPYRLHRDSPCMASFRERSESPIFSDRERTVVHRPEHFPFHPRNNYVGNVDYDLPHGGPMGRQHVHMHVHQHECDDFYNDDDGDGDPYGYIPQRIPVRERIVEREDREPRPPVRERIKHPFNSRKPTFSHGAKYRGPQDAIYHGKNVKKRLGPGPSDESYNYKPTRKYQKRSLNENESENFDDDNLKNEKEVNSEKEDDESEMIGLRRDPVEGSEEFKREVDKAFMKFATKIIGTSREKKKYLQPGTGSLHCYVCGSDSKTFAGTHNLVVHTYHTKKPGLKTAHLGLQKALCLLMGWNWLVVPDESRTYQIAPPGEAKVLKQDLLIWPPIVVICNSSVECKVDKPNVVCIPGIESMLKGIGIEEGKWKVCYGKPANQSVFLVKFEPTLPGYELAKILHSHFSNKNHGKEHFDQLIQNRTNKEGEKRKEKGACSDKEEVLYGYIAGIEDLDKLDGTKVKIKSKKREIEAAVNAS